jgi:hypothetical protein
MTGGRGVGRVPVLFVVRTVGLELPPRCLSAVGPCQGLASHGYSGYVHRGISRVGQEGYSRRLTAADGG